MMSKAKKSVIITAGVLLGLGCILLILVLTPPPTAVQPEAVVSSGSSGAYIIDKRSDNVAVIRTENENGVFAFNRQERSVDDKTEYFWTSGELLGVPQDDALVKNFIANLVSLPNLGTVEENAENLEKYGLKNPRSTAVITFDDGTTVTMRFGIRNPVDESAVYFLLDDSRTVKLVSFNAVEGVFKSINQFAQLTLTEKYNSDGSTKLEMLSVFRSDLEEPIEIALKAESENSENSESAALSNTHRFTAPISADIDPAKGRNVCYGIYGLTMQSCEFLEQTEENLQKCGLKDPQTAVKFKYGGKEYELSIGGEIREETAVTSGEPISSVTGYYAVMKGVAGIYSIAKSDAVWCTFSVGDIISSRPLSPYIYDVKSVEVTVPDGKFEFEIDGKNKSFSIDGKSLSAEEFKSYYQTLIGAVGEEYYSGEVSGEAFASVTFHYEVGSDTMSYYKSDDRKCIVALNGEPIFKVRSIYVERLCENTAALINGGRVNSDW